MQFILIGHDGKDQGAIERRMAVREKHLERANKLKESGNLIWGGALLDKNDKMVGSVIVYDYPSRGGLDKMLEKEPYITGGVWENIKIENFKLAKI